MGNPRFADQFTKDVVFTNSKIIYLSDIILSNSYEVNDH